MTSWPVCDSVMAAERPARPAPMMRMLRGMPVLGMALWRGEVIFQVCARVAFEVGCGIINRMIKQNAKRSSVTER